MENMVNFYDVLGVNSNASNEEIIRAYKQKAKEYHPDVNGGSKPADAMFKLIGLAKDVLTDPIRRKDHDAKLKVKNNEEPKEVNNGSSIGQIVGWSLLALILGIAIGGSSSSKS